jgi:hypothetical protein
MNLHLHFILINSEFNQGLADDLYQGEESEDNIKHLWEDELQVSEPVKEFKISNNDNYTLAGYFPDNTAFAFEIPDMTIVNVTTIKGNTMQFAVSKKLLKKTDKQTDEKSNDTHLFFYLRDNIPMENPFNGVYINKQDFPAQLKKTNNQKHNG